MTEIVWTAVCILLLNTTGCNAVKGLGKDLHDAAQFVQDTLEHELGTHDHRRQW